MAVIMVGNQSSTVIADEDYSNSEYWLNRCTNYGKDDASACEAYKAYLESQNAEMSQQIAAWKAQKADMEANISKYAAKISEYQTQIDTKQAEITQKEAEIDAKQKEIDSKQAEIDQNQKTADKLQDKVKTRMVLNQPTMRTNQYIDILMGANNFTDFIRIANGLSTISQYDKKTLNELVQIIATLNKQKEELVVAKNELEIQKKEKQEQTEVNKTSFMSIELLPNNQITLEGKPIGLDSISSVASRFILKHAKKHVIYIHSNPESNYNSYFKLQNALALAYQAIAHDLPQRIVENAYENDKGGEQ